MAHNLYLGIVKPIYAALQYCDILSNRVLFIALIKHDLNHELTYNFDLINNAVKEDSFFNLGCLMRLIPTILCGGAGSRLWPVSRELHPKPFIRLADGQSLLQKAFLRGAALPGVEEVLTVTNRDLLFKTEDEYREIKPDNIATSYILEPFGRNTAPAIAMAALLVEETYGPDVQMLVLAADHLISDQAAFADAVAKAVVLARQDKIVTFGIHPDAPENGYGYIQAQGNDVLRFVEKPSYEKAQEYVSNGDYLWNSGMFCFKVGALLRAMELVAPEILAEAKKCMDKSRLAKGRDFVQLEIDAATFVNVPSISIDYAVMEKCSNIAVVPCDIGWSDIGSWSALGNLVAPDKNGNRIETHERGEARAIKIDFKHRARAVIATP